MRGQYLIEPTMFSSENWGLTPLQEKICVDAQQAIKTPTKQMQDVMLGYHWKEYLAIISKQGVPYPIRIICVSAVKNLVYQKRFVDQPEDFFNSFLELYLSGQSVEPTKIQQLMENIFRAVSQTLLTEKMSQNYLKILIEHMHNNPSSGLKITTIIQLLVEEIESQSLNNEEIVGEVFLFIEQILPSPHLGFESKALIITGLIKLCEKIIDLANLQEEDDNIPEEHLRNSIQVRAILQQIISQNQQGQLQILSHDSIINKLKLAAISLHSILWIYHLEPNMFKLFVSTLISRPDTLMDEQMDIMEKVVIMIERSIGQEQYATFLHASTQQISMSLLKMLTPTLSYLDLVDSDPEQFVQIGEDFSLQQHNQMLLTRAGSLLSVLCMQIDGFLSFIGSMLIMILKRYCGTVDQISDQSTMTDYFTKIDALFNVPQEIQTATTVFMLCALSNQFQKRQDLIRPLIAEIYSMNKIFKMGQCPFPPYLICRFMLLTAFYPFPGCMDVFLPYKNVKPVYDCQLQACYRILTRYMNKKSNSTIEYIKQIEPIMILSDHLTPTLEAAIINEKSTLSVPVQFMILQKLVLWMEDGIHASNIVACNKVSSLIGSVIERLAPEPATQKDTEQALFGYLQQLYCAQLGEKTHPGEQFLVDIATFHVKQFPILEQNEERLSLFMNMSCSIIQKNNYIMNNCLELLGAMLVITPYNITYNLAQLLMKWLPIQQREEERWEYFYLLEISVLRMGKLNMPLPTFDIGFVDSILQQTSDKVLATKIMMFLYSLQFVQPNGNNNISQYLSSKLVPQAIPPYQNKPFCLYIIHLLTTIECNMEYTEYLLNHIFLSIKRQEKIQAEIKKYQNDTYNLEQHTSEVAINAFTRTRFIHHPLLDIKFSIFQFFSKLWRSLNCKQQILANLGNEGRQFLENLLSQKIVNKKVRKIVKVKRDAFNDQMKD